MKNQQRWIVALFAAVFSVGLSVGCDDRHDSAILPPPPPPPPQVGGAPQQPPAPPRRQITWQLPMRWKDRPSTQPSEMAVGVSDENPDLLLKGKLIPIGAESSLVTIVNNWEKQVGRPPSDKSAVEGSIVKPYITNGLSGNFVDLSPPDGSDSNQRLLGAVFPDPRGVLIAFTLAGPSEQVGGQLENFRQFIDSLRVVEIASDNGQPQQTQAPQQGAPGGGVATNFNLRYQIPPNWVSAKPPEGTDLDLHFGDQQNPVRIIVSRMQPDLFTQVMKDPNIMRQQAGIKPLPAGEKHQAYQVAVGPDQGILFDFSNPPGETPRRTLFAVNQHTPGGVVLCVQLMGPSDQIEGRKADLDAFLRSIQYLPAGQQ